jgi:ParB-like nuclease family protein
MIYKIICLQLCKPILRALMRLDWHLEVLPIKSLKKHPKNPREITKKRLTHLENLINKFGMIDKPIVNKDGTIIGGHQRIRILKKKKAKNVECWVPDKQLSDEDVDELCIGLNLNQGTWDFDCLANMWEPIDLLTYGFTEQQLIGCCNDEAEEEKEATKKSKKQKECPACGHQF